MFRKKKIEPSDREELPEELGEIGDDMLVIVDQAVSPYLVMFHDPASYRAEQIRGLRNKLIAMNPDGQSKTLVMTSAMKGEGKTISAVNLAIAFAELEHHPVLLVDADLRSPSVEKLLNLNPQPGLADVLLGNKNASQVIRSSGVRNLSIIGAGKRLAGPSELLTTNRVDELFSALKEQYRYVIVDTPPVLPATDASVMAQRADGTMLTVRLEHSQKAMTKDALRTLQDLGSNILGVFVTEVRGKDPDKDPRYTYDMEDEGY